MRMPREIIACGLWVASLALLTFGTMDTLRVGSPSPFLAWGLWLEGLAFVPTGSLVIRRECERRKDEEAVTVQQIAEVVDALHRSSEVSRLR